MQGFALFGVFVAAVIVVALVSGILGIFLDPKDDNMFWCWLIAVVIAAASIMIQYSQSLPT